ncbi:hypothetical protein RFI_27690 [Reticulomyxa filosa]|uniref:Uncharacterized protein n=1 Tax=Reticulomyxa filosa TaxID=46433 RepID=X6M9J2_RETFI|nr:hypothetical protein RFI_27690 [Reticulomyxa filosa]|eukprot:ETO09685.1 hypothetical protein RFI_27690 [Reticulomyxa filosa]
MTQKLFETLPVTWSQISSQEQGNVVKMVSQLLIRDKLFDEKNRVLLVESFRILIDSIVAISAAHRVAIWLMFDMSVRTYVLRLCGYIIEYGFEKIKPIDSSTEKEHVSYSLDLFQSIAKLLTIVTWKTKANSESNNPVSEVDRTSVQFVQQVSCFAFLFKRLLETENDHLIHWCAQIYLTEKISVLSDVLDKVVSNFLNVETAEKLLSACIKIE